MWLLSGIVHGLLLVQLYGCCYARASRRADVHLTRDGCAGIVERASIMRSPRDRVVLADLRGACCASALPSAAERRLTLTPLGVSRRLGRTIPC